MRRATQAAVLYRMALPDHLCPYGLKARDLLRWRGYAIDDRPLTTRAAVEAFKARHGVSTTPQIFIGEHRLGGYDELRRFLGLRVAETDSVSYRPVIVLFGVSALMALAAAHAAGDALLSARALQWFVAFGMCLLALPKLQDVESFTTMFLNYDLLARRRVAYGYVYPIAELLAGVLMIADVAPWLSIPTAAFIGGVGAVSVTKAVYIDKRELKCACLGGSSRAPLGLVSLIENVMMIAMAGWMLWRHV